MAPLLLVTRPVETAKDFASKVLNRLSQPVEVIFSPALEIVPLNPEILVTPDHLILTSANAVRQAVRLNIKVNGRVWCIGNRTTTLSKTLGFSASQAGNCATELIETVLADAVEGRILHLSGVHTRGDIVETLAKNGRIAERTIAYDQRRVELNSDALRALKGTNNVVLPLFSPRSAGQFTLSESNAPLHIVAMSDAVRGSLPSNVRQRVEVVKSPDEGQMVDATVRMLEQLMI